jgi:hypothetical protein
MWLSLVAYRISSFSAHYAQEWACKINEKIRLAKITALQKSKEAFEAELRKFPALITAYNELNEMHQQLTVHEKNNKRARYE